MHSCPYKQRSEIFLDRRILARFGPEHSAINRRISTTRDQILVALPVAFARIQFRLSVELAQSQDMLDLRDCAKERKVSWEDLLALADWKEQDPDVPDGEWYKDFGSFKLCGNGKFPSASLLPRKAARRKRL